MSELHLQDKFHRLSKKLPTTILPISPLKPHENLQVWELIDNKKGVDGWNLEPSNPLVVRLLS
jgi:hypothetical protein